MCSIVGLKMCLLVEGFATVGCFAHVFIVLGLLGDLHARIMLET